ncbi:MAG: hypothetical protein IPP64_09885 [Bacteroidetes bacterium]|nr:hypothetical protein [Bacteroidota bacterium]
MKTLLKISLLATGITFGTSLFAQEDIKKEAATTADKLESPKPAETKTGKQEPVKSDKQEPVKATPAPAGTSKSESKADSSKGGGTRMAITEQGMPKKNKKKAASKAAPPAEAPKK